MWMGEYQKFRMLLISVQFVLPMASSASGTEAVLPLAAPELGILPVLVMLHKKLRTEFKKSGKGFYTPWHSLQWVTN